MNDLVEKIKPALVTEMMNAYFAASKTPYSYPPNVCDGFGAAAKVLLEAALGECADCCSTVFSVVGSA